MAETTRPVHRNICERIVVTGTLVLTSPAQFGSGDTAPGVDMALMEDESDGSPLLPGTSIAGALRSYLTERELGYAALPSNNLKKSDSRHGAAAERLLGGSREDPEGAQSPLIVHDALGTIIARELRDGVAIDPTTRTAKDEKRYNMEVLPAGTRFELRFELLVSEPKADREVLIQSLITALHGLESGEITLGRRKRRGFGECRVENWRMWDFPLDSPQGLLAWLAQDHPEWMANELRATEFASIQSAFGGKVVLLPDARSQLDLRAEFSLESSLLIRSGFGEADLGSDVTHLHSMRANPGGGESRQPVLPGTSLGGALRARARRILLTLNPERVDAAKGMLDSLFGPEDVESGAVATASRLETRESVIRGGKRAVQNRIRIDRFTGGAYETALFNEEALFGAGKARVELTIKVRNPSDGEVGLLLLLLKDLWAGDLRLGGGSNIGRGQFKGVSARLSLADQRWEFHQQEGGKLAFSAGQPAGLEQYVASLVKEIVS